MGTVLSFSPHERRAGPLTNANYSAMYPPAATLPRLSNENANLPPPEPPEPPERSLSKHSNFLQALSWRRLSTAGRKRLDNNSNPRPARTPLDAIHPCVDNNRNIQTTLSKLTKSFFFVCRQISYPLKPFLVDGKRERFWDRCVDMIGRLSGPMLRINADPRFFTDVFTELKAVGGAV
ncbi:Cyclin-dependent kinase 5 activator 1 [Amphibalanus amphitrite]|uniref:Cyclin-dependent kinase 5 activator 1 n=1 Tax=Amphibalanus amphitrite TaxID=1232801 RepID=A0A6A4W1K3_AMPAM|nr:Cyclin-dependent kinase 5 activator 1 [Amphibalanus amphitrite]